MTKQVKMYALGIPISQYRRATQVLGPESADPIDYESEKQDADFYLFKFPNMDEYDFKEIVILLKGNGISTIGADAQLTERKIMKLVDILNEQESPKDNRDIEDSQSIIDKLKYMLEVWEMKDYNTDREKWEEYFLDVQELIDDYDEEISMKGITKDSPLNENIKKLVKKELRKLI
jgi:hypothetical protein|tara:strand:- start:176 stop:703 length:528 start_codon:yes stop_codon:yes gene_type:complete